MFRITSPIILAFVGTFCGVTLLADVPRIPLRYHHPLEGQSAHAPFIGTTGAAVELSSLQARWQEDGSTFKPGDLSDVAKQNRVKAWVNLTDRITETLRTHSVQERANWSRALRICAEHPNLIDSVRAICWKRWSSIRDVESPSSAEPNVPSRVAALSEIL